MSCIIIYTHHLSLVPSRFTTYQVQNRQTYIYQYRYQIQCARRVSGITFIKVERLESQIIFKIFGSNKTKRPKQDSQNLLRSPIPEGGELRSPIHEGEELRSPIPEGGELRSPIPEGEEPLL